MRFGWLARTALYLGCSRLAAVPSADQPLRGSSRSTLICLCVPIEIAHPSQVEADQSQDRNEDDHAEANDSQSCSADVTHDHRPKEIIVLLDCQRPKRTIVARHAENIRHVRHVNKAKSNEPKRRGMYGQQN